MVFLCITVVIDTTGYTSDEIASLHSIVDAKSRRERKSVNTSADESKLVGDLVASCGPSSHGNMSALVFPGPNSLSMLRYGQESGGVGKGVSVC